MTHPPDPSVRGVRITHPDRVIDAASGATKLELARYYDSVAPHLLPHLKARPVALVRAPDGVEGELFFQKHLQQLSIPKLRELDVALDPGHAPLMVIDKPAALVGAAQMGTVELHTWNALHTSIEKPDRVVFDLDPGAGLPWARMVEAAELTKTLLDELGLASFLKTSGGKGLHVVVPLARRHGWEQAKAFVKAVAQHMAATLPQRFSARAGPRNRVGKVFVDYLRNGRGATSVAAFSARARPMLPVSVPIAWEELVELRSANQWNIRNLAQRLRDLEGADPWAGYAAVKQTLGEPLRHLQAGEASPDEDTARPSKRAGATPPLPPA
jgi:bifunctional non-homologous end joining protein LigD